MGKIEAKFGKSCSIRFGQIWLDLGNIKILYPQKHLFYKQILAKRLFFLHLYCLIFSVKGLECEQSRQVWFLENKKIQKSARISHCIFQVQDRFVQNEQHYLLSFLILVFSYQLMMLIVHSERN